MGQHGMWTIGAVIVAAIAVYGCCPCGTSSKGSGDGTATKQTGGRATGEPPQCSGEMADSELPCTLPDSRTGWCKGGRCKDICPAGFSYSPLDTACHKTCTAKCGNCMEGFCFDDATTRPLLEE